MRIHWHALAAASLYLSHGCAHRSGNTGYASATSAQERWKDTRRKKWIEELGEKFELRTVQFQNSSREYLLFTPASYRSTRPSPMVVGFHGGTTSDVRFARTTLFHRLAEEKGFLVAYPNGVGGNWNDGRGTANPDLDDVGFVMALIEDVKSRRSLDAKRIYATGISNGAFMVQRLACEKSDRIAAFSAAAGSMGTLLREKCNPKYPVPMLLMNSPKDRIVPWHGGDMQHGKGGKILSVPELADFWKNINECGASSEETLQNSRVSTASRVKVLRFEGCRNNANVALYRIEDGGHTWPDGDDQPAVVVGPTSKQFNATQVSWDFFRQHALP